MKGHQKAGKGHSFLKTRQFLFVEPRDYAKSNAKSTCHHQTGSILADIPWAVASQQRSYHWTEVKCSGQRFADTFWDYEPTASWCWDSLLGDESKEETWKKHKMRDQQKNCLVPSDYFGVWGLTAEYTGWWFQIFFTPISGRFPIWLLYMIFFRLVETTNQYVYIYTYREHFVFPKDWNTDRHGWLDVTFSEIHNLFCKQPGTLW